MQDLFDTLKSRGLKIATAESCTGGMIAKTITDCAGSSAIFDVGYVTYSNAAKIDLLDVSEALLNDRGAVSPEVAREMAAGALSRSGSDIAVSCTGIAGPDGGTDEKPVGLVYIGLAVKGEYVKSFRHVFSGDRASVREQTVETALNHVRESLL